MQFHMLLFPPTMDKIVSVKLQKTPIAHEWRVSLFLPHVLHDDENVEVKSWAVDLGANVGHHTLHVAALLGATVTVLEPAPDVERLLRAGFTLNPAFCGSVAFAEAGASNKHSVGHLVRHGDSLEFTALAKAADLPWSLR
jgi:hypothetical protein